MTGLIVLAPLGGTVVSLADVPDPVFAQHMVGPGTCIDPQRTGTLEVVSPVSGTVVKLHPHAFVVQVDHRAVLVHLGLDTVGLAGRGFTLHVAEGDHVEAGDRMVTWDVACVVAAGLVPLCPVIALGGEGADVEVRAAAGDVVEVGAPLVVWT